MTCAVDFKKMAFCTLFVKDGVAERVALGLRLHDDTLGHAGNLSITLINNVFNVCLRVHDIILVHNICELKTTAAIVE